ncbi:glyceraldehyde 3-phosphate dehydrogenase N-terminal domain-containing protein [Pseudomonas aeruginosa]|nr:glyceraldehyde 3-phosphate dehydrogenase N-terminal domain-containing protein [Pseudomonas aeruginosa]
MPELSLPMSTPPFRVALNGYGRIGRCVLRALHERPEQLGFEIVALNDLADQASVEYLTRFDSTHGRFPGEVKVDGDRLHINGDCVKVLRSPTPEAIDWQALRVDLVLECSGQYTNRAQAERFLRAGAPPVLFSQPMASEADIDATIVYGVNQQDLSGRENAGLQRLLHDQLRGAAAQAAERGDRPGIRVDHHHPLGDERPAGDRRLPP